LLPWIWFPWGILKMNLFAFSQNIAVVRRSNRPILGYLGHTIDLSSVWHCFASLSRPHSAFLVALTRMWEFSFDHQVYGLQLLLGISIDWLWPVHINLYSPVDRLLNKHFYSLLVWMEKTTTAAIAAKRFSLSSQIIAAIKLCRKHICRYSDGNFHVLGSAFQAGNFVEYCVKHIFLSADFFFFG